ncbi:MAG: glycoside hydrolase family 5 protein [Treponema sp.]|nr:glycoside hydrolase family 5 protein [Treponema sp.]
MKKLFTVIILISVIGIIAEAQTTDPRPRSPQPMSNKTAMEYFRDEGIKIGINLGNTLDAVDNWTDPRNPTSIETAWGNPRAEQAYFHGVKAQGFDIMRIPVTWVGHIGPAPDYKIEETWLRRVAEVVNMALNARLKAFINVHHDGNHGTGGGWLFIDKAARDSSITDKFEKVWKQIAEYFINYGDNLMFQGFNEIHSGDWGAGNAAQYRIINDWNQRFTNVVRSTGGNNAKRYLLYYGYNTHYTIATTNFSRFVLPADSAGEGRQIVGFHYYEPVPFVLQVTSVNWGSAAEKRAIETAFSAMKQKFIDNNIPVIIGENGPFRYINYKGHTGYRAANAPVHQGNRLAYVEHFYTQARINGLVSFFWENGTLDNEYAVEGDGSLLNRVTGQPNLPENAEIIQRMMNAAGK